MFSLNLKWLAHFPQWFLHKLHKLSISRLKGRKRKVVEIYISFTPYKGEGREAYASYVKIAQKMPQQHENTVEKCFSAIFLFCATYAEFCFPGRTIPNKKWIYDPVGFSQRHILSGFTNPGQPLVNFLKWRKGQRLTLRGLIKMAP